MNKQPAKENKFQYKNIRCSRCHHKSVSFTGYIINKYEYIIVRGYKHVSLIPLVSELVISTISCPKCKHVRHYDCSIVEDEQFVYQYQSISGKYPPIPYFDY